MPPRHLRPNGKRCSWREGCDRKAVGDSAFCATHRAEVRRIKRQRIAEQYELARMRREENAALREAAERAAANARRNGATLPLRVVVKPATQSFAHYIRKAEPDDWRPADGGGLERVFEAAPAGVAYASTLKEWGVGVRAFGEVPL